VVALHARGVGHVVAPLGTAFTGAQAKLLKRFAPSVVVLFDGDNAGRKATRASRQPCRDGGLDAKVAVLPRGLDPDDFVRKNGPEALVKVIQNARGMREHLIEDALDGESFKNGSLEEQRARLRAVMQILAEENDPNLRAMSKTYADKLSSKLLVQGQPYTNLRELEAAIDEALRAGERAQPARKGPPAPPPVPHDRARSRSLKEQISLDVLGALFDYPELLDDPAVQEACGQLEGDHVTAYIALRQFVMDHATTGPTQHGHPGSHEGDPEGPPLVRRLEIGVYAAEFLAQIPPSIQAFAVGRLASPAFETPDVARTVLFENAEKLRRLSLTRENAAVVDEVQKAAVRGDDESWMALLREADRAARSKRGLS
jgi:DNA primase